jgi:ABC-type xylose transport system substrate-binding protein
MGTWGVKTFDNDSSLDWVADFETEGADALQAALEEVADAERDAEIEADEACCALAAAEIVAALKTGDVSRLSEEARTALTNYRDDIDADALSPIAVRAATRTKDGSELHDLWEESDQYDAWIGDIEALIDHLR